MHPIFFQVDVFSFGILLCEILARIPADPETLPRTQVTLEKKYNFHNTVEEGWKDGLYVYKVYWQQKL